MCAAVLLNRRADTRSARRGGSGDPPRKGVVYARNLKMLQPHAGLSAVVSLFRDEGGRRARLLQPRLKDTPSALPGGEGQKKTGVKSLPDDPGHSELPRIRPPFGNLCRRRSRRSTTPPRVSALPWRQVKQPGKLRWAPDGKDANRFTHTSKYTAKCRDCQIPATQFGQHNSGGFSGGLPPYPRHPPPGRRNSTRCRAFPAFQASLRPSGRPAQVR